MINNINDLFIKYKKNIQSKKNIEENFILFFKENTNIILTKKNIDLSIKNKTIKIINLSSSNRFIIKNTLLNNNLKEYLNNNINYIIII